MRDVASLRTPVMQRSTRTFQWLGWPEMPRMCKPFYTTSQKENHSPWIQGRFEVLADKSVNADKAELVGQAIVQSRHSRLVGEYKFCKKNQVSTLASSIYITVDEECLDINPSVLFPCLVAGIGTDETQTLFTWVVILPHSSVWYLSLDASDDNSSLQTGLVKKVPLCVESQWPKDVVYILMVVLSCNNCRCSTRQHAPICPQFICKICTVSKKLTAPPLLTMWCSIGTPDLHPPSEPDLLLYSCTQLLWILVTFWVLAPSKS